MTLDMLFQKLTPLVKSGGLSVAAAFVGFAFHQAVASNAAEHKLEEHDVQIQKLIAGQEATHEDLNKISITIARVEGKLGVIDQKIDDDRSTRSAPSSRH
jgi:hypothetical protein